MPGRSGIRAFAAPLVVFLVQKKGARVYQVERRQLAYFQCNAIRFVVRHAREALLSIARVRSQKGYPGRSPFSIVSISLFLTDFHLAMWRT